MLVLCFFMNTWLWWPGASLEVDISPSSLGVDVGNKWPLNCYQVDTSLSLSTLVYVAYEYFTTIPQQYGILSSVWAARRWATRRRQQVTKLSFSILSSFMKLLFPPFYGKEKSLKNGAAARASRGWKPGIEISRIYGPLLTLFQLGASVVRSRNGHDIQRASANSLNSLGAQNTLRKESEPTSTTTSIYEAIQLNEFLC